METKRSEWWKDGGGFFGSHYMVGDNSVDGYLPGRKESLEERTEREVEGVVRLLGIKHGDFILDCPCGYGRHTIELWEKGFNVAGVDINLEFLSRAYEEALIYQELYNLALNNIIPPLQKPGELEFGVGDMKYLADPGTESYKKEIARYFDAVINMFLSFGFFETEQENELVMRNFNHVLKKNGKLLMHTDVSPEMINSGNYRLNEERKLGDGGKLIIDEEYDRSERRLRGSWTVVGRNGAEVRLAPYSVRIYSAGEFEEMARRCGFRGVSIYGSFDGERFTAASREMIVVAGK